MDQLLLHVIEVRRDRGFVPEGDPPLDRQAGETTEIQPHVGGVGSVVSPARRQLYKKIY